MKDKQAFKRLQDDPLSITNKQHLRFTVSTAPDLHALRFWTKTHINTGTACKLHTE